MYVSRVSFISVMKLLYRLPKSFTPKYHLTPVAVMVNLSKSHTVLLYFSSEVNSVRSQALCLVSQQKSTFSFGTLRRFDRRYCSNLIRSWYRIAVVASRRCPVDGCCPDYTRDNSSLELEVKVYRVWRTG